MTSLDSLLKASSFDLCKDWAISLFHDVQNCNVICLVNLHLSYVNIKSGDLLVVKRPKEVEIFCSRW